jgi:hypothetical protein
MPWMQVKIIIEGGTVESQIATHTVDDLLNIDEIVRVGKMPAGNCYVRMTDGMSITLADGYDEVLKVILQAEAKETK